MLKAERDEASRLRKTMQLFIADTNPNPNPDGRKYVALMAEESEYSRSGYEKVIRDLQSSLHDAQLLPLSPDKNLIQEIARLDEELDEKREELDLVKMNSGLLLQEEEAPNPNPNPNPNPKQACSYKKRRLSLREARRPWSLN